MSVKVSTGLRNAMLNALHTRPAAALFAALEFHIYGGTVPATADAAIGSATLLTKITGCDFDAAGGAADGVLQKEAASWSATNEAFGADTVATFYRIVETGDTGALSTTAKRIQGTVGTAGADLNLTNTTLVQSTAQTVDYYSLALPTA